MIAWDLKPQTRTLTATTSQTPEQIAAMVDRLHAAQTVTISNHVERQATVSATRETPRRCHYCGQVATHFVLDSIPCCNECQ